MASIDTVAERVYEKLDAMNTSLTEIKVQLAKTEDHSERIKTLESDVAGFQKDRAKVIGIVAVVAAAVPQLSTWLGGLVP